MSKDPEREFLHFTSVKILLRNILQGKGQYLGLGGESLHLEATNLKTIYFSDCNFPKLPKYRKEEKKEKRNCVEKIDGAVNFDGHKLFPRLKLNAWA